MTTLPVPALSKVPDPPTPVLDLWTETEEERARRWVKEYEEEMGHPPHNLPSILRLVRQ